eukprot:12191614-Alexandrium_andersonii.AAC.1
MRVRARPREAHHHPEQPPAGCRSARRAPVLPWTLGPQADGWSRCEGRLRYEGHVALPVALVPHPRRVLRGG